MLKTMQMTSGIHAERAALAGLARAYVWFSHHRGTTVELPGMSRHLSIGFPLTAARAVICAVALQEHAEGGALASGCVRVLANPPDEEGGRLVFAGRVQSRLTREEAGSMVREMLDSIAACILFEDLLEPAGYSATSLHALSGR